MSLGGDQRFLLVVLIGLASGCWLMGGITAQTFTAEDRGSILKFMDVLMNFLDAESDNATISTEMPTNETTTVDPNESTTTDDAATVTTTSSSTTVAGETTQDTSTTAVNSTDSDSSSSSTTSSSSSATSSSTTAIPLRKRICFKRVCYKFANDRGYIY